MGRRIPAQEKLALMMTSAGSMRNLAALVGVSHQRIGRWLREGEPGGAKQIPYDSDPAIRKAIDTAFGIHSQIAKEQSRVDKLPFSKDVPIFQFKKPRSDGKPSDRVFIEHARFLRKEARDRLIKTQAKSQKFYTLTIRSELDVDEYFKNLAQEAQGKGRKGSISQIAKQIKKGFEERDGKRIVNTRLALFTPRELVGKMMDRDGNMVQLDPSKVAQRIDEVLQEKHIPATNAPGSKLADIFVYQLAPTLDPKQSRNVNKPKQAKRAKWSNKRGK